MSVERKGIDVSKHNGTLNWDLIKASGIDFAILRTGFGKSAPSQKDGQFEKNYSEAKRVGMPIGVYHYSYAVSVEQAVMEANFVIEIIKGKQFEYPIYFDIEDKSQQSLSKKLCTDMINAFCTTLEKAGYWAGLYSYDSFFTTHIDSSIQSRFAIWVASVENRKPVWCRTYQAWQYSWKGKIAGHTCDFDMNTCYVDYPTLIKNAGKNGYSGNSSSAPAVTKPTTPQYRFTSDCGTEAECKKIQETIIKYVGSGYAGKITKIN